jgi:hypothetical protein
MAGISREETAMEKFHSIENVSCTAGRLSLVVDGKPLEFALEKVSKSLANATIEQLANFEISPSGYGIHWPLLDEDISIDGLLGISHKPDTNRRSA